MELPSHAVPATRLLNLLKKLSNESRELDVGWSVDRVGRLSAVEFLREYVGPNKPVVLSGITDHWPAHQRWSDEYLLRAIGGAEVTVALTPNGRADAVTPLPPMPNGSNAAADAGPQGECFALPAQYRMPFPDFVALFYATKQQRQQQQQPGAPQQNIPYLQFQNSSLTAELPRLLEDVDEHMAFATEAFGGLPEAINFWWGDERSTTTFHKDPFENLYIVVSGRKTFTLLPPCDAFRMRLRSYPLATYQAATVPAEAAGGGPGLAERRLEPALGAAADAATAKLVPVLNEPRQEVLWSSVQPEDAWRLLGRGGEEGVCNGGVKKCSSGGGSGVCSSGSSSGHPSSSAGGWAGDLFADPQLPRPLRVTVGPGDCLYLPALWYHQVEQQADETGRVIAVNYWYDLKHDCKFAYATALEELAAALGLAERLGSSAEASS